MALHVYRKALQYFGGPGDKVWKYVNIINLELTMKLTDFGYIYHNILTTFFLLI